MTKNSVLVMLQVILALIGSTLILTGASFVHTIRTSDLYTNNDIIESRPSDTIISESTKPSIIDNDDSLNIEVGASPTILIEPLLEIEEEVDIIEDESETDNRISTVITFNPNDVTQITGVSAETLDYILADTWLAGHGDIFHEMEETYGINAMFSIGNAIQETGWEGDNWLARNKNNIYGLNMSKGFDSKRTCIEYWYRLISEHYVGNGRRSIAAISTKYCPPDSKHWQKSIPKIATKLITNANITLE